MATNTWVRSTFSTGAWAGGMGPMPPLVAAIPAGGIIKRFQVNGAFTSMEQSLNSNAHSGDAIWQHDVSWNQGGPDIRLYKSSVRLGHTAAALYDPATLERIYTEWWGGGDEILSFSQGCSRGKHTDVVPSSVTYTPGLTGGFVLGNWLAGGYLQYGFDVLYETIP